MFQFNKYTGLIESWLTIVCLTKYFFIAKTHINE